MRLFLALILFLFGTGIAAADNSLSERDWNVDGVTRQALIHVPANATRSATPVVFVFHGHGGSMANGARSFAIHELWPEAIVVYMQGLPTPGALTDHAGERAGWQARRGDQGDRDLKFFDAVFASLQKDFKVDTRRVYATGHSNGGGFTYLLWAYRGDVFAAVAPSSAVAASALPDLKPKPALHVAGENDPLVRYAWQDRSMSKERELNGCEASGEPWASAGTVIGTQYRSRSGTPYVSLIHPGGHQFPKEVPALIVRFFKEH